MYKQAQLMFGQTEPSCVIRTTDGAAIPFDSDNRDYVEYLAWLAEGNAPTPAETPEG